MKYFLVLLLAVPFLSEAQDSCKLRKLADPYTKQTKISTGFVSFVSDGNQLNVSIDANSTEIDFFFWFKNDTKCFDDQSAVQVNYDGEKLKSNYKNTGSMNCEGAFHFTFKNSENTPSNLLRFTDKKISSLKFTSTDKKNTEVKLTEEQKQQLQRMVSCVVKEAKTLIKK